MSSNRSYLIIFLLIPLAVGSLSSLLSGNLSAATYIQPAFSPPAYIFSIVWTVLYLLMGFSSFLIYTSDNPCKNNALKIYFFQLVLNFFWSIIFFHLSNYLLAFFWLIGLINAIIVMLYKFKKISPVAAYLQFPYLLWCLFAAFLNFGVYQLN